MGATIPEPTALHTFAAVASTVLLTFGGAVVASGLGLLKGRRPKPARPSLGRVAVGGVMLVAGLIVLALSSQPPPEPDVIATNRFSSSRLPALSVSAPDPWRLEYDSRTGKLTGAVPGRHLMIETSLVNDAPDAAVLAKSIGDDLRHKGLSPGPRLNQAIDGIPSVGEVGTIGSRSTAYWVVGRVAQLYTIIVCSADDGAEARLACDPILSTLKWRAPGPL